MRRDISALEIRPGQGTLVVGTPVQLNLFALTGGGGTDLVPGNMASWASSDDKVAEINRQGRLTPRRPGALTVTARYGDKQIQAAFTVRGSGPLPS